MNIEHKDVLTSKAPSYRGCFGGFEAADKQASFPSKEIEMKASFIQNHEIAREDFSWHKEKRCAEGPREGWKTADALVRATARLLNGEPPRFGWEEELEKRMKGQERITPGVIVGWGAVDILARFAGAAIKCRRDRVL